MGWNIYRGCNQKKLPSDILYYQSVGRRDTGRPRRRWLDVWGRNELAGSTLAADDDDMLESTLGWTWEYAEREIQAFEMLVRKNLRNLRGNV
jgi:hypothetical protein